MLRKWIVILVIVLVLGWVFYDYFSKEQTKKEATQTEDIAEMEVADDAEDRERFVDDKVDIGIERGNIAPDFTLETLDGETVRLSDFHGEKILLNFWASWCPPCHTETPDLQKFHESNNDVVVLSVNVTETEDDLDDVQAFIDEYGVTYETLLDEDLTVANMYQAHQLPTSYLINTEGKVHNIAIGPVTYEMLAKEFYKVQ